MRFKHSTLRRTVCLSTLLALVLFVGAATAAAKLEKPLLNVKSKTLHVGSNGPVLSFQLNMVNENPNLPVAKSWKSSKPSIATVDESGLVTPVKQGTASIVLTITDGAKKAKASCKITVKNVLPTSVSFDKPRSVIAVGERFTLNPVILPANALNKKINYKSSNKAVATVSSQGEVLAKKAGKVTISCTTAAAKKKTSVTLVVAPSFAGTKYRFFGIGNANYQGDSKLNGCKTDLNLVKAAYQGASFSGQNVEITARLNLNGAGIRSLLNSMAQGAGPNDVTVFYYSGHGMAGGKYNGALCGINWDMVTVEEVRKALDKVPGKVVVLLDCCLSGQYITSRAPNAADARAFNQAFVDAFASNISASTKALTDSPQKDKYKIITASGPNQASYVSRDRGDARSVFTEYLAEGLGIELGERVAALAADKNKDSVVTLAELYAYIDKNVRAYVKRYPASQQTTMIWPRGDGFPVLARN